jgi:PKD repeat protein
MTGTAPDLNEPDWVGPLTLAPGEMVTYGVDMGPVFFIQNEGQFDDDDVVLYGDYARGGIAFKAGRVLINLEEPVVNDGFDPYPTSTSRDRTTYQRYQKLLDNAVRGSTVELTFEGGNDVVPRGEGLGPGVYNYFLGDGPVDWTTGVGTYSRVVYEGLYEGIDLVYMVTPSGPKYEFQVGPGADPSVISVRVDGHTSLTLHHQTLVIGTSVADIQDTGLDVFYADGARERLESTFDIRGPDSYGFIVNDRDSERAMVIDPLVFSTYLGSSQWDRAGAIVIDDEGYLYITGNSDGTDFPTTTGSYQKDLNNFQDIFVLKMAPDGESLVWSTFIGGTDLDIGYGLTLDDMGNVYVCGVTNSDNYPTTPSAFQSKTSGNGDAFASKLNPSGSRLLASTLVGGFWEDPALSIAVDASQNMYITGYTRSEDFPTTTGAYDVVANPSDAYVTKINATATDLVYSTYLGGSGQEAGDSIVLDGNGSAYVVGNTWSNDFPVTNGSFRVNPSGSADSFVSKVDPNGTSLEASTYLGGQFFDEASGVALGSDGDVHVFGMTQSDDFPVTAGAFQTTHGSARVDYDAFATRMNWNLSSIKTSTFIGGDAEDYFPDGTLDPEGNVIIGGTTASSNYPTTDGAYQTQKAAFTDAVITKLSANYTELEYSTHIGSVDTDQGIAVAGYRTLNVCLIGDTFSDKFPTTPGALQTKTSGNRDAFVAMFSLDLVPPVAFAGPDVVIDQHEIVLFNGSGSWDNIEVANWTWAFSYDGADVEIYGTSPSWTFDQAGYFEVTLTVADGARQEASDTVNVTVVDITAPVAEAGASRTIRQGETIAFDGTGSTDNVGIVDWTWAFEYFGQEVFLQGPLAEFTFDRAGSFNVTLTVRDEVGLNATDSVLIDVTDLTSPIANAGEDIYVDQFEPAVLNGSLSSDTTAVVNWTWSFVHAGTPVEVYGQVTLFIFEHAGSYEVLLRVADAAGNSAIDTMTVHVRDAALPLADPGPDQEVSEGALVQFDGSGSSDNEGIVAFEWTFDYGGEAVILDGVDPTYTFHFPGTYLVTLMVTDAEDNTAEGTMSVTVLDITPPEAVAGVYLGVVQGAPVTLDGTLSSDNVGIVSFVWTFEYRGEIVTLEGGTTPFTFDDAGFYEVTLTVTDVAGNFADDSSIITVKDIMPPVIPERNDITIDQRQGINVSAENVTDNVGVTSYTWSFLYDGKTVSYDRVWMSHQFHVPGLYEITLTAGDQEGNSAVDSFTVTVRDIDVPVIVMDTKRVTVGVGQTVTKDASASTDNVDIVRWEWTFEDDGKILSLDEPIFEHAFDKPGEYLVLLTVEDAEGNVASETFMVTVTSNGGLYILLALIIIVVVGIALFVTIRKGGMGLDGKE